MNPVTTGLIAATALIAAFAAGLMIDFDGGAQDGPLEQAGEALDNAASSGG
ncbi:hypothetical protein G5B40_09680 [Pikeienuella piscinae]|uniref:Uncharacterized protein n=1 Tax=Pikeienuella piscinae TaxID=2748098 RepID=A0A7L5BVD1_9RHOB|nr:hypothetical protein [Pikeienuella piscinae]QIE55692.1 hypothetical protein G5B40_09680 [Pikeienuella piscinae]